MSNVLMYLGIVQGFTTGRGGWARVMVLQLVT